MSLTRLLSLNACFTLACGLGCLFAADLLARHIPLPAFLIQLLGGALVAFVLMLVVATRKPHPALVRLIIVLDWMYVVLAAVTALWLYRGYDAVGWTLEIGSAGIVALFAILQARALKREARA
jgi:hypothetical protein